MKANFILSFKKCLRQTLSIRSVTVTFHSQILTDAYKFRGLQEHFYGSLYKHNSLKTTLTPDRIIQAAFYWSNRAFYPRQLILSCIF